MAVNLVINVPDIASVIATYDVVRVFRSTATRDGPFVEVTAATPQPASLVGTVVGPYTSLNGKTLILRVTTQAGVRPDSAPADAPAGGVFVSRPQWRWCEGIEIKIQAA